MGSPILFFGLLIIITGLIYVIFLKHYKELLEIQNKTIAVYKERIEQLEDC